MGALRGRSLAAKPLLEGTPPDGAVPGTSCISEADSVRAALGVRFQKSASVKSQWSGDHARGALATYFGSRCSYGDGCRACFQKSTRSSTCLLGRSTPTSRGLLVCAPRPNAARSARSGLSKVRCRGHRALSRGLPRKGRAAQLVPHAQAASRPALRARSSCAAEVGRPGRAAVGRTRGLPSHPRRLSHCGGQAIDQGWRGNDPRPPPPCEESASGRLVRSGEPATHAGRLKLGERRFCQGWTVLNAGAAFVASVAEWRRRSKAVYSR